MALAVTQLGTATFNTTSGTKTVTATPAVGDLILIVVANSGSTASVAPTDNNGSGTYSLVNTSVKASSADTLQVWVRNALIAAASSTIFTHAPGTTTGGGLVVLKVTGMNRAGSAAIRQSAIQSNQAASGTPTPVLGSAALTTNALVAAVFNATNPATMTPRASPAWTEVYDNGYTTPTTGLEVMAINSGETASSIAWGGTSASAFGSIVVEIDATQVLAASLFSGTNTFYVATVAPGSVDLTPGLFTSSTNAFYAASVALGGSTQTLTPGLYSGTQTFFAPTVAAGAVSLAPGLLSGAQSFYAPAVAAGAVSLAPSRVDNVASFYAPVVGSGAVSLAPGLLLGAASFYAPTVALGAVTIAPARVDNLASFYAPAVGRGAVAIAPARLDNAPSFYAPAIAPGAVDLLPQLLSSSTAFHAPTVAPSDAALAPGLFANAGVFYAPRVATGGTAPPGARSTAQTFYFRLWHGWPS